MQAEQMWKQFVAEKQLAPQMCAYTAWAFGASADELARLVLEGKKTATASAYDLYAKSGEPLPKEGEYSVILDGAGEAVCIICTSKVYVVPFCEVSAVQAYKEGEGDRSLAYWRKVHRDFFTRALAEAGLVFDENSRVVCEEFAVVYR